MKIMYMHDDTETLKDAFTIQLTDGGHTVQGTAVCPHHTSQWWKAMATKVRMPWDKFRAKKADESGNGGGILVAKTGQEQKGEDQSWIGFGGGGQHNLYCTCGWGICVSLTE